MSHLCSRLLKAAEDTHDEAGDRILVCQETCILNHVLRKMLDYPGAEQTTISNVVGRDFIRNRIDHLEVLGWPQLSIGVFSTTSPSRMARHLCDAWIANGMRSMSTRKSQTSA